MYSIVNVKSFAQVCQVRTIEEAFNMLKKWQNYEPTSEFEIMECA